MHRGGGNGPVERVRYPFAWWLRYRALPGLSIVVMCGATAVSTVAVVGSSPLNDAGVPFLDWVTYAAATHRYLDGRAIYDAAQVAGPYELPDVVLTGYAYPPPSVFIVAPFSSFPFGLLAWLLLNAFLLVVSLALILRRELSVPAVPAMTLAVVAVAVLPPFVDGMSAGNANVGLAGLLGIVWLTGPRSSATFGAALGGAMLKVFPSLLAAWYARGGRVRALSWFAVGMFAVLAVSVAIQGVEPWLDFASVLSNATPACGEALPSLPCALQPALGAGAKTAALGIAMLLGVGSLLVRNRVVAFLVLIAAMQAPVVDMWPHYRLFILVGLWIALAVLVRRVIELERRRPLAQPSSIEAEAS